MYRKLSADAKTMIVLISIIITDKGHSKKSIQQHTNAFEDLSTLSRSYVPANSHALGVSLTPAG